MNRILRTSLFTFFLLIFFIGAPVVVLYTAGYRYNPRNGHVVRTGALSATTVPRGASITLNGSATGKQTPYVFSRIVPGSYVVTLSLDGYHATERTIDIRSGSATYVNDITLFAVVEPTLLVDEKAQQRAIAQKNSSAQTAAVTLVHNKTAVEVRRSDDNELVAFLPPGTYHIAETDGDIAIITSTQEKIYLLNMRAESPILLADEGTIFDWDSERKKLVWSDGIEMSMFDTRQGVTDFVTRQSDPVRSLALYDDTTLFVATSTHISARTLHEDVTPITLADAENIEEIWKDDGAKTLYFSTGTENGVNVYELELR